MATLGLSNGVNGFHEDILYRKASVVTDRLQKREDDRQAEISKRKEEKIDSVNNEESPEFFTEHFLKEKENIENAIATCSQNASDRTVMRERFDIVAQSYQKLNKFVSDSTMFLPSYQIRQAQETMVKLNSFIQEKRDLYLPKKKFSFASKKKIEKHSNGYTTGAQNIADKPTKNIEVELAGCKIVELQGQTVVRNNEDVDEKDVALANLNDCTIKLFGTPSTVHMKKLKNCTILCGPVSSSIFISDCSECVFVLACQQLRTHTTTDSRIYLHVTSRAIIEDCKDLQFAPYRYSYVLIKYLERIKY